MLKIRAGQTTGILCRCCAVLGRLVRSRSGATSIEYGLIAVLVSVAGIVAFNSLGDAVSSLYGYISGEITPIERCAEVESSCNK